MYLLHLDHQSSLDVDHVGARLTPNRKTDHGITVCKGNTALLVVIEPDFGYVAKANQRVTTTDNDHLSQFFHALESTHGA